MRSSLAPAAYVALGLVFLFSPLLQAEPATRPNVLLLYFDDMGYGDCGAYVPTEFEIPEDSAFLVPAEKTLTPEIDHLASQGIKFTHAHSADGVCTPSRYALVTGRYCWRTTLKSGVLGGISPPLMAPDRYTIGRMYQEAGYRTAMVGKWHLGMQFFAEDGTAYEGGHKYRLLESGAIDFSKPLTGTPHHFGFDYFFGTSGSLDMLPYLWIESAEGKVHALANGGIVTDSGEVDFSKARHATNADLKEGPTEYSKKGVFDPGFKHRDYLQVQAKKVSNLIEEWQAEEEAFFIYVPLPAPHSPHAVQERFAGSAGFTYGDYVVQSDYYVGEMIRALGDPADPGSAAANTIVIVTSDNGPAKEAGLSQGHDSNGPFKGKKRDNWEGGTRVPFVVRWPGVVEPGSTDYACSQVDIFATLAEVIGFDLPDGAAEDSVSFLPVLKNADSDYQRAKPFIEHSSKGQFAIVDPAGRWKFLDGTGGGGNAKATDADNQIIEDAAGVIGGEPGQLYDLHNDPGERTNLLLGSPAEEILAKKKELKRQLQEIMGGDGPEATDRDHLDSAG